MNLKRLQKINWQQVIEVTISVAALLIAIITLRVAYVGLNYAGEQLKSSAKATSEQLTESFNRDISSKVETGITAAIDSGKPILWKNGGAYSDYQLENYLGIYEAMDGAYTSGQIDRSDFCDLFSYYLDEAAKNEEVQSYISKINNDGENYYGGFIDLEARAQSDCDEQNHAIISSDLVTVAGVTQAMEQHQTRFPHISLSDFLSVLNVLILAGTAVIVWIYTKAAQRSNEIQEKPVLNLEFINSTVNGGQLDGAFELKNIGKGCAYNISFTHISLREGTITFTYKPFINEEVLEIGDTGRLHAYTGGSDGRTEGDMSRFFFRMSQPENETRENGNRILCAVIFVINYEGINGDSYHSIFRFYPRLIMAYDPKMQFIKHGEGKYTKEMAEAFCTKIERVKSIGQT